MKCSLGAFAYNEEKNIGKLLEGVLNQNLEKVEIDEIFVVASGCTDRTVPVAREFAQRNPRIKVLVQKKREGKYSAINLFLENSRNDILVMESADTVPKENAIENLLKPFEDPAVGMAGSRPVPVDNPKTFLGFTVHLLWELHHQISLKTPKTGEMVAFKRLLKELPPTAVDEAYVEGVIKKQGFKIVYVPEAIVYNKGAGTIADFLKQRRRIYAGHLVLKEKGGHEVSTMGVTKVLPLVLKSMDFSLRNLFFLPGAILLETSARFLGWWDYKVKKKDHVVWEIAGTARGLDRNHES